MGELAGAAVCDNIGLEEEWSIGARGTCAG